MAGTGLSLLYFSALWWRLLPNQSYWKGNYGEVVALSFLLEYPSDLGYYPKAYFMSRQAETWNVGCFFLYRGFLMINRLVTFRGTAPETYRSRLKWFRWESKLPFPLIHRGRVISYFSWWLFPLHCVLSGLRWIGFIWFAGCIFSWCRLWNSCNQSCAKQKEVMLHMRQNETQYGKPNRDALCLRSFGKEQEYSAGIEQSMACSGARAMT